MLVYQFFLYVVIYACMYQKHITSLIKILSQCWNFYVPGDFYCWPVLLKEWKIFQVWSNDKYESVEHKAMVNPERERFSIPFFFNPAHYTMIKPLEEMTNEQNPTKYRAYNWGKFMGLAKDVVIILMLKISKFLILGYQIKLVRGTTICLASNHF